jgi:hypothetical protein
MKCREMARKYNIGMISDGGHLGKDGNISKNDNHNIKSIEVDSGKNEDGSGMAKIKVKFKSDTKPEMISRLIDAYIQKMDDSGTK